MSQKEPEESRAGETSGPVKTFPLTVKPSPLDRLLTSASTLSKVYKAGAARVHLSSAKHKEQPSSGRMDQQLRRATRLLFNGDFSTNNLLPRSYDVAEQATFSRTEETNPLKDVFPASRHVAHIDLLPIISGCHLCAVTHEPMLQCDKRTCSFTQGFAAVLVWRLWWRLLAWIYISF